MKLAAIHHVAIIVSDYEKSKDFYVNKLGFAHDITSATMLYYGQLFVKI